MFRCAQHDVETGKGLWFGQWMWWVENPTHPTAYGGNGMSPYRSEMRYSRVEAGLSGGDMWNGFPHLNLSGWVDGCH